MKPVAIDPLECDCSRCRTGEHVPIERAFDRPEVLSDMLAGRIANSSGRVFEVKLVGRFGTLGQPFSVAAADKVVVTSGWLSCEVDPAVFGAA